MSRPPVGLTIAGSDPSGGAGIQADLKTFSALGVYGTSVITALTAQSTLGVTGVHVVPTEFVTQQLETLIADVRLDAIKIGMLANAAIVGAVGDFLRRHPHHFVVLDPVMVATSGDRLLDDDAIRRQDLRAGDPIWRSSPRRRSPAHCDRSLWPRREVRHRRRKRSSRASFPACRLEDLEQVHRI